MALAPGTRIGQYEIHDTVAGGGMGVVYRAFDTRLKRLVALKLLSVADEADAQLLREARAVAALNHPYICAVHEVGTVNGVSFLAMEFVEGPVATSPGGVHRIAH